MPTQLKNFRAIFTLIGGWVSYWIGGFDSLVYTLLSFAIVDYITGVFCAVYKHEISSKVGFKGISKKIFMFLLVGIAHTIDSKVLGQGNVIKTATIFFYIANEGISILENATILGMPVPKKLKDMLIQIKNDSNNINGGDTDETD